VLIFSSKNIGRLTVVFSAGAWKMMTAFNSFIISLLVVRLYSPSFWGGLVAVLLFIDLGFAIVNWGFAPYLDHAFSFNPNNVKALWYKSLVSRLLPLCAFIGIVGFWGFSLSVQIIIAVWSLMRFSYQSFDPIILFERNFLFSFVVEIIGLISLAIPILIFHEALTANEIMVLYSVSFAVRAALTITFYRDFFRPPSGPVTMGDIKEFFSQAFPFLLLTFSAMLQQRIDLYICALYLPTTETAQYQVLLNLLLLSQVGANLLLAPFTKNIFRLPASAMRKLEKKFIEVGLILALLCIASIYGILTLGYRFHLHGVSYVMGYVYILMFYFYLVRVYDLRKSSRQTTIVYCSFAGCAVNLLASFLLVPRFGLNGALFSGMTTQIFITVLYRSPVFMRRTDTGNIL